LKARNQNKPTDWLYGGRNWKRTLSHIKKSKAEKRKKTIPKGVRQKGLVGLVVTWNSAFKCRTPKRQNPYWRHKGGNAANQKEGKKAGLAEGEGQMAHQA